MKSNKKAPVRCNGSRALEKLITIILPQIGGDYKKEGTQMEEDMVYTVKEASKVLKCNVGYVYELIRSGRLHAIKLGSMKVLKSTLITFLNEHEGLDLTDLDDVKPIQVGIIQTN